jgi:hypothetical protein
MRRIDLVRAIGGALVLAVTSGCGSAPRLGPESPYTDKDRGDFGVSCRRQGLATKDCDCIFNYYKEEIDYDTFKEIMAAGATPHEIADTISERCGVQVRRV